MIGPPGMPKIGRRVFSFAGKPATRASMRPIAWKWTVGLYLAGVLAHFGDHMAWELSSGVPLDEVLASAPICLVWPADLIGTLIALT